MGYTYLSLKNLSFDARSNIVPSLFRESLEKINPAATTQDMDRLLDELSMLLDNEDLGKAFYERIIDASGLKVIDFENFDQNSFHVVTEYTCKNDDEFRPDITLLINGLPLVFIEVKKPNNPEGISAEKDRFIRRFKNPKFRRFINATQLMMFSNNMEYDNESPEPLAGAFYATSTYQEPCFNFFREPEEFDLSKLLSPECEQTENAVLSDNKLASIKYSTEFATNKDPHTPTHRLCSSLFSRERLAFLLRFGLAYVRTNHSYEKHIMRYPQIFATKAIESTIASGARKGIIWHTQGSGKTALAFYNVRYLTDYFKKQNIVPKFYFIVDRIDLLTQASREFESRGLKVYHISSREAFAKDIKSNLAIHNDSGKAEITVVNIQRFKDDTDVLRNSDYALGIQRVYFLDEVHRSYNPEGSFLANLNQSDPNAIKIGLTGTPLLHASITPSQAAKAQGKGKQAYSSRVLFGEYIHKYYYNHSIKDGYTLRLIREEIETQYKLRLQEALEQIKVLKDGKNRKFVYSHEAFVEPMLDYIVDDFEKARILKNDHSIGAMVICDSSEQAKQMAEIFARKYALGPKIQEPVEERLNYAAEEPKIYQFSKKSVKTCALILHDAGTKEERKNLVEAFKEGKIDILFVFNMLLTGFDSARLKKLYLGRVIKAHNLLQALTRVNRPYKNYRYGHVVDFVDIEREFEKTNQDYFDELKSELGDELESYSDLFKTEQEIEADIETIKDVLFPFDLQNGEVFSQQISQIEDRAEIRNILKALNNAKTLYNLIRLSGRYELLEKLDFRKLNQLSTETAHRLQLLNQREALLHSDDHTNLLNIALEDVFFAFRKIDEGELLIADELRNQLRRTREGLAGNFDQRDPVFISLKEELERLFKKKDLSEITQDEMVENISSLKRIDALARELERKNQLLLAKYAQDEKYVRLHKRLLEKGEPTDSERKLFEALSDFRAEADARILSNSRILTNEAFAKTEMTRLIIEQFKNKHKLPLSAESTQFINSLVMREYLAEFHSNSPTA